MATPEAPMTLTEAAAYVRCHPSTLKRRVARGEIGASLRGRLLFRRTELDAYLDRGRVEPRNGESAATEPRSLRVLGPQRINPLTNRPYAPEVAARLEADMGTVAKQRKAAR